MNVQEIAQVCHEANRAYCQSMGDESQAPWHEAPDWQKQSAINGVQYLLDNPESSPAATHENWLKEKLENGWQYGKDKNPEKKTHPCIMPYHHLPPHQRAKDHIFRGVVLALRQHLRVV